MSEPYMDDDYSCPEPFVTTWLEGEDEMLYRNGHDLYEIEQMEACLYETIENAMSMMQAKNTPGENLERVHDFFTSPVYFLESKDSALTMHGLDRMDALYFSQIPSIARIIGNGVFSDDPKLNTYIKMSEYLKTLFIGLHEECFYLIMLDSRGHLKQTVLIETGTIDTVLFRLGDVITAVLNHAAKAVVFCHNHPRGTLKPSDDDVACTLYALSAMKVIGVPLLDHIIIAGNKALSFRDSGIIPHKLWVDQAPRCKLVRQWLKHEVF